jgi:hypothetical protein
LVADAETTPEREYDWPLEAITVCSRATGGMTVLSRGSNINVAFQRREKSLIYSEEI